MRKKHPSTREKRIKQIVDSTLRCIGDNGYSKVTMQLISEYTGLSKGAINHYFKKKEDILIAVLNEVDRQLFVFLDEKIRKTDNVENYLRYRLSGNFEIHKFNPALLYILFDFLALSIRGNTLYTDIIKRLFKKYRYLSSIGVKLGQKAGLYRNVMPEDLGAIIVGIIIGIGSQWIMERGSFDYDNAAKIAEDMIVNYLKNEGKNLISDK